MNARSGLTPRAVLIGLICAIAACFVVIWAELVARTIQIAILQFAPAAIGFFLVVVILNVILRNISLRIAFSSREMIAIYMMVLVAALLTSRGLLEKLVPALIAYNYYATPANNWAELFFSHTPQWAVPFDVGGPAGQYVATAFYEGLRPGVAVPWAQWAMPLAAWAIVSVSMLFCFACLAAILRKQWVDNEKLIFPLTQLPLALARDKKGAGSFFRNKLMWIGFAIPTVIFILNGLHAINPSIPQIPLHHSLNAAFSGLGASWAAMGYTTAYISLAAIGFAYFLSSELLFSLWFFYWFVRLENVIFAALGMGGEAMPLYPTSLLNGYQVAGAYLVLVAYIIKSAWPHLREFARRAFSSQSEADKEREFLPPRVALYGLAIASMICIYWFIQLGMSPLMAVLELGIYLFVVVPVMARSVAEAGMLMTETSFRPVDLVRLFTTEASLGPGNLTSLSLVDAVFTRDLRGNLLSTFLDGLKMSDVVKLDRRALLYAVAIGVLIAFVVGGYLHVVTPYHNGAITMYGYIYQGNPIWGFKHFAAALQVGDNYDARLPAYFGSGVVIAAALSVLRVRYVWWPLMPLAWALSGSWSMIVFWFPFLLAWIIKGVIVRYGGWTIYTRLQPFFLGLILGEFSQAVIWATIGGIWRVPTPFFPWP